MCFLVLSQGFGKIYFKGTKIIVEIVLRDHRKIWKRSSEHVLSFLFFQTEINSKIMIKAHVAGIVKPAPFSITDFKTFVEL